MEHSMEFHGTLVPPNDISLSSIEFHGTLVTPNEVSLSSMEFHGTLRLSFYDLLPCTSKEYPTEQNIPWNTMELCCRQMKYQLVPWNSMEYSMEFHGTLVPPNDISLSSMEFHGTLTLSFYSMSCYPGIPWDILWNSGELYRVVK